MKRIVLVCERSGGHLFPALAVAQKLRQTHEVSLFATASRLREYCIKESFPVFGRPFLSRNIFLEGPWRIVEALVILARVRPHCVIGFGGRDGFFLVLFARFLGIKTAIYEANRIFGKANNVLSLFVHTVLKGFPSESDNSKVRAVGIPLRETIRRIDKSCAREELGFDHRPVVLCCGGSQGSSFVNEVFTQAVKSLPVDCQIIHITGSGEYFKIVSFYNTIRRRVFIRDFYYAMETLYSAADVAVSRAGASTLAELAYYQLPSILIPHPGGGAHQRQNAAYFAEHGASVVFSQKDFVFDQFAETLATVLSDTKRRDQMQRGMKSIGMGVAYSTFSPEPFLT